LSSTKKKLGSSTRNPNILANDRTPMSFSLASCLPDPAKKIKRNQSPREDTECLASKKRPCK